jgi:hypothetical protein
MASFAPDPEVWANGRTLLAVEPWRPSAAFTCLPWRLGYSSEHHAMLTFSRLVDKTGHDPTKSPGASRTGAFFAFALLSQTCRARCTRYMPWVARRSARPRFFIRWLMYETVISAYGTKRTCKPR